MLLLLFPHHVVHGVAYECEIGYTNVTGDIPGWGSIDGRGYGASVASCAACASLCDDTAGCRSYECSPTALLCNLNDVALPTKPISFLDFAFCVRNEFLGNKC